MAAMAAVVAAQCSSYCSSCSGGGGGGGGSWSTPGIVQTCQSCPSGYNSTGSGNPCIVDTDRYLLEMEIQNGDFTFNDSSTNVCGGITPSAVPGIFAPTAIVEIYVNTAMPAHYLLRVRGMALFVDRWDSGDKVYIKVDGVTKASRSYGNANSVGCSGGGSCSSSSSSCGTDSNR